MQNVFYNENSLIILIKTIKTIGGGYEKSLA